MVGNDNCVHYKAKNLQIPPQRHRHRYVKARVRVHEYPDGTFAVFDGPRRLAHYAADGRLRDEQKRAAYIRSDERIAFIGLWICGRRQAVAHNPTGPATAAEI